MLRPGLISWSSAALAALLGCERATPAASSQATASAEPQQVIAPLVPRALDPARETAKDPAKETERDDAASGSAVAAAPAAGPVAEVRTAEGSAAAPTRDATDTSAGSSAAGGAPSATCVNGWTAPGRGSPLRKAALDMIRERKSERFVVVEMRYFRGPEDAEVIGPQREVERWYVKAQSTGRNARRQRWLVRRAEVGRGIDAVADFDSTGYAPGTWKRPDASDDSVSDPFQRPCERRAAGEKCMGLPYAVLGCLDGS